MPKKFLVIINSGPLWDGWDDTVEAETAIDAVNIAVGDRFQSVEEFKLEAQSDKRWTVTGLGDPDEVTGSVDLLPAQI